jgi:hypothetical protein
MVAEHGNSIFTAIPGALTGNTKPSPKHGKP